MNPFEKWYCDYMKLQNAKERRFALRKRDDVYVDHVVAIAYESWKAVGALYQKRDEAKPVPVDDGSGRGASWTPYKCHRCMDEGVVQLFGTIPIKYAVCPICEGFPGGRNLGGIVL